MKVNKRIKIRGKVQGVFFRKSTLKKARQLNLKGWVQNEPDGSVLTVIEGSVQAVLEMEQWLRSGPEQAEVEDLIIQNGTCQDYLDFTIRD